MDTPTNYSNICKKALDVKDKYSLTDTQTLLYNHICRGDFKLRNEDGQNFYDKENKGFGYSGSRDWVKKQFQPLIKEGLVKFISLRDCNDYKYTSWYFYDPLFNLDDLVDAGCYVSTHKLAMIKHCLNLPDGFDKHNKKYGDIEFIFNDKAKFQPYTFKYKNEGSIYSWDHNGKGEKQDLSWLNQGDHNKKFIKKSTWNSPLHYEDFSNMLHDIWSFLAHDGYEYKSTPNTTEKRIFSLTELTNIWQKDI